MVFYSLSKQIVNEIIIYLLIKQSILPARACPSLCELEPLGLTLGLDKSKEEKKARLKN
jgi:hypothetical protein